MRLNQNDELVIRAGAYGVELDFRSFYAMPARWLDNFVLFHKELSNWSASGSVDWRGIPYVSMPWEGEKYLPPAFLGRARISEFPQIGIAFSFDFAHGYIFSAPISCLEIDVLALCNGSAFAFGIDNNGPSFASLLELRWPDRIYAALR